MPEDNIVYIERPNDNRDYIERTQSKSVDYTGREMTAAEMAQTFALCDIDKRVDILQSLAKDDGEISLTRAARRLEFEGAMRNVHEILRKAGR